MKPHTILKDFKGSQTGHDYHEFKAGTVADLSNGLAAIAVKEGWAEPYEPVTLASRPHPEPVAEPDATNERVEQKSEGDAPENKALHAAPENKKKKR